MIGLLNRRLRGHIVVKEVVAAPKKSLPPLSC